MSIDFVFSLGKAVGGSPWITIIISLAVCGGCLIGVFKFTQENRADKLWTPEDSIAQRHKEWVEKHFPAELRVSTVLLVAKNVLTPEVLQEVSYKRTKSMRSNKGLVGPGSCGYLQISGLKSF